MTTQATEQMTVDTSGTLCPVPVIRARQALDKLGPGQVLKLIATDPGSKADIPSLARTAGYTLLKTEEQDRRFLFWLRK
jgi:tRNA 2-thiouridine synthesizing protein A